MFRPKPPLFQRLRGCLCLALVLVTVMANPAIGPRLRSGKFTISDEDRAYWAFQPVRAPSIPATGDAHPVDALLAKALAAIGRLGLQGMPLPQAARPGGEPADTRLHLAMAGRTPTGFTTQAPLRACRSTWRSAPPPAVKAQTR